MYNDVGIQGLDRSRKAQVQQRDAKMATARFGVESRGRTRVAPASPPVWSSHVTFARVLALTYATQTEISEAEAEDFSEHTVLDISSLSIVSRPD